LSNITDVNANNWDIEVLQHKTLVIVDFWHPRCLWCLQLNTIYEAVSKKYEGSAKFAKLDVLASPENREIAIKYGIMGTPSLVFFCTGRPIETVTGLQTEEGLKQLVEDMLSKYPECIEKSTVLN
jgi:thioredoxin 1